MRILTSLFLMTILVLLSCGCFRYGGGESVGYVTTTEKGIVWNYVHFRSSLMSSQTDAYLISTHNEELRGRLLESSEKNERIKISYVRHLSTVSTAGCQDEIVGFTVIKETK